MQAWLLGLQAIQRVGETSCSHSEKIPEFFNLKSGVLGKFSLVTAEISCEANESFVCQLQWGVGTIAGVSERQELGHPPSPGHPRFQPENPGACVAPKNFSCLFCFSSEINCESVKLSHLGTNIL